MSLRNRLLGCVVMLISSLLFAGCATPKLKLGQVDKARLALVTSGEAVMTAKEAKEKNAINTMTTRQTAEEKLGTSFMEVILACKDALAGFENRATNLGWARVGMATVGALAGSVAVPALVAAAPAANAVWTSAFGGIAGVMSASQMAMSETGLTTSAMLSTREKALNDWKEQMKDYFSSNDQSVRQNSLEKGLAACVLYSITVPDSGVE